MSEIFDQTASSDLETVYLTPDVISQRAATLDVLAPVLGDRVIDVGAGPGLLAVDIARTVGPSGHVTAIDISESMLDIARRRCIAAGVSDRVTIARADATAIPVADGACDLATITQVLEYVQDVDAALSELRRVLRPGGRLVIVDTDWSSLVWNSSEVEPMGTIVRAWIQRFADPFLPRTLTLRLRRLGFEVTRRQVHVIFNPEYDPDTYSITNSRIMARYAAGLGISSDQIEDWLDDFRHLGEDGSYFFSLNRYLFAATRGRD